MLGIAIINDSTSATQKNEAIALWVYEIARHRWIRN